MVAIEHPNNLMRLFVEISKNGKWKRRQGINNEINFLLFVIFFLYTKMSIESNEKVNVNPLIKDVL